MTLANLLQDIEFWTGLNITPDLKPKIVNRLNRRYEWALSILGNNKGIDDTNYSTQSFSFFDIVEGQNDYEFLTDEEGNSITDITAVLLKVGNDYIPLRKLNLGDEMAELVMSPNLSNTGIPTAYLERNNSIFFDKIPNYSKENGGKLFYKRVPSYFGVDDDWKEPGFHANHHQILSLKTAYDWLLVNKSNAKTLISRLELEAEKAEMEFRLYAQLRNPEMRRLTFRQEDTR